MKSRKLPITVVIPCATDLKLKNCLESIDENCEVIVVLNGSTKKVEEISDLFPVKKVKVKQRNLPKALNVGIKAASNQKILLVDSDCILKKGSIKTVYESLKSNKVTKGKVIFCKNDFLSGLISNTRDYTYSRSVKAYNPLLGLRKDLKEDIGGFYFDSRIYWTEDADLHQRVVKAGVSIDWVPNAIAYHPPLTLKQDLTSAFRYGIGKRIRVEKNTAKGVGHHFGDIIDVIHKKGFWTGVYYFFWNCSYSFGYCYQIVKNPYQTRHLSSTK